jgi:hypothetical protein
MQTSLSLACAAALLLLVGCSDREDPPPASDSGVSADLGSDAGDDADSGAEIDAAADLDLGAMMSDGAVESDSGADSGRPACVIPGLGDACGDTAGGAPCPTGFDCDLGRCLPQDRETCGGFAGARCTDGDRTECVYEHGHGDVGTCFTPTEVGCICVFDAARWVCS